ncbi:sensor histidine kinase [Haloglycomyces albus]|uniref:sensor histidine kinase n=1 Tax=Haloglycomyces albus TaxID=526067 RepID=UPI00146FB15E|nr:nitrate- and nitrite sensing domain-containing protein [Haloglycomyces albus]
MSKRSSSRKASAVKRGALGFPRISDMRIRSKLGLILLIPLIVLLAVASLRLYDLTDRAFDADDMVNLVEFNDITAELRFNLQRERSELVTFLRRDSDYVEGLDPDDYTEESMRKLMAASDESFDDFVQAGQNLPLDNDEIDRRITLVADTRESLKRIRDNALEDPETSSIASTSRVYQNMIGSLVTITDVSARVVTDPEIARQFQVMAAVTELLEQTEEERAIAVSVGNGKTFFNNGRARDFAFRANQREKAQEDFQSLSNRDEQQSFYFGSGGLETNEVQLATEFEDETKAANSDTPLDVSAELLASYDALLEGGAGFIDEVSTETLSDAQSEREAQIFQLLLETIVILVALIVATLVALVIARNMANGLKRLREGALDVAHVSLPRAVAEMRDQDALGSRTPDEVAADAGKAIEIDQRDEIGNVAQAFNIVHTEAIRISAEQSALRANVATMFVNLARRSQGLVDRLIGHLDELERGEEDPDRLSELFKLDHLATRMRRNDENLLVLAGADSSRQERHPAQVGDILQAAQSEVEHYTRIEFGQIQTDRDVKPAAVNDVVHLVAELMDNATSFSPPESGVLSEAVQLKVNHPEPGDGIRIRIIDSGIGMSDAQINEINEQLSHDTSSVDITTSRMMGLVVVARLAQRHGIRAELHAGAERGIIAEIILPESVLTEPKLNRRPADNTANIPSIPDSPEGMFGTSQPAPMSPPMPNGQADPLNGSAPSIPSQREPAPPPQPAGDGGLMFRPGGFSEPTPAEEQRPMEVTGEIVHSENVALPKIQLEAAPQPEPPSWMDTANTGGTAQPQENSGRISALDETTELPIYREAESAWFKATTPPPQPATDAAPKGEPESVPGGSGSVTPSDTVESDASISTSDGNTMSEQRSADAGSQTGSPESAAATSGTTPAAESASEPQGAQEDAYRRRLGSSSPADSTNGEESAYSWRTAADSAWERVDSALGSEETDTTANGLPKRRPGAKLLPGGVTEPQETVSAQKRNPEGIRGLLSAYHRGVQRGRGSDN